jgi:hypothetical protein
MVGLNADYALTADHAAVKAPNREDGRPHGAVLFEVGPARSRVLEARSGNVPGMLNREEK